MPEGLKVVRRVVRSKTEKELCQAEAKGDVVGICFCLGDSVRCELRMRMGQKEVGGMVGAGVAKEGKCGI